MADNNKIVEQIFELQQQTIDRKTSEKLEKFYVDIFDGDVKLASEATDVWISAGLTFESLSTMMRSAASFSVAFDLVSFALFLL